MSDRLTLPCAMCGRGLSSLTLCPHCHKGLCHFCYQEHSLTFTCAAEVSRATEGLQAQVSKLERELALVGDLAKGIAYDRDIDIKGLQAERDHWHSHYDAAVANWNQALAECERLREVAQEAFVVLEGLRLSVQWELAPQIMAKIQELCPRLAAALSESAPAKCPTCGGKGRIQTAWLDSSVSCIECNGTGEPAPKEEANGPIKG